MARVLCFLLLFAELYSCAHRKWKTVRNFPDFVAIVFNQGETVELPERRYDKPLEAFLPEFVSDAGKRGVHIPDETADMLRQMIYVDKLTAANEPGVIAACARFYTWEKDIMEKRQVRWMTIEVLRKESEDYSGGDRIRLRELVFHELFHCLLNKGHLPKGVPGIMAPTLNKSNPRVYTDWDGLVDEMFSQKYLDLIPDAT
ncbi:MAG: hypothetical protein HYW48_00035 [Deltaproteobacteria bacterium]|nr:hypothetical protein [Deltaproteobacteria bacterium]